jgi:hypothetical protein
MRVSAHQPDFLPYAGFWLKAAAADTFVLLPTLTTMRSDSRGNYQSRQRIGGWDGPVVLSIPTVSGMGVENFDHVVLDPTVRQGKLTWVEEHLLRVRLSYGWGCHWVPVDEQQERSRRIELKAIETTAAARRASRRPTPHFASYYPELATVYRSGERSLGAFNTRLIDFLMSVARSPVEMVDGRDVDLDVAFADPVDGERLEATVERTLRTLADLGSPRVPSAADVARVASALEDPTRKLAATARLIRLCQATGADAYLSGSGARAYVVDEVFGALGFRHELFSPTVESYPQIHTTDFDPHLCALDRLFHLGHV